MSASQYLAEGRKISRCADVQMREYADVFDVRMKLQMIIK